MKKTENQDATILTSLGNVKTVGGELKLDELGVAYNTLKSVEELYTNEFPKFTQSYTLMNNASYESFDKIKVCNHQTKFSDGRETVKNASINITRNLETTRIILSPESVKHLIEALQNIDRII